MTAVEWAADHVAQLGGDPERLSVAGVGEGAALAAEAARLMVTSLTLRSR